MLYRINYSSFLVIVFLFSTVTLVAHDSKSDSLIVSLQNEKNDSSRVNIMMQISGGYRTSNPDTSLYYLKSALQLLNNPKWNVPVLPENWKIKKRAQCYQSIAILHRMQGDYAGALEYNFNALGIFEKINDSSGVALIKGNIGNVYLEQKQYEHALVYYEQALKLDSIRKNDSGMARHYGNMGAAYYGLKNIDLALIYYFKYLLQGRALGRKDYEMIALGNIGVAYEELKKPDSALVYYDKAKTISKELGYVSAEATYIGNMGWIYCQLGDYSISESLLSYALKTSYEIKALQLVVEFEMKISDLYERMGKFDKSLFHYKEYVTMKDSIFNVENTEKAIRAEVDFEFEKKEQKAKLEQEKKDALAKEEKRRSNIILLAIIIGFVVVLIFSVIIFNRFRISNQQKKIIEKQKQIVEQKNKDITDSINYAQRIQQALLASETLLKDSLGKISNDYFILFRPKDIVSGDFYWAISKNNEFYLAVCDSTGHGVPGAFMSLLNISYMHEAISEKNVSDPAAVFNHVRNRLHDNISADGGKDGMDGILLKIPLSAGKEEINISYASAHNPPLLIIDKKIKHSDYDKMPVGSGDSIASFNNYTLTLAKGTSMYLYSDGYPDQFGGESAKNQNKGFGSGKKFKQKKLQELLASISDLPMAQQKVLLENRLIEWQGDLEQTDDITIIGIRF